MADITWEDGEDVTWDQGEDVTWESAPESPASKPIEGLGKEKTFLEKAAEMPVEEKPLGQRMAEVTPEKILKAGAVGIEEAIPAPTTALAAGLTSAVESLSAGRPQRPEDIAAKYQEMVGAKEQIKSEAPGIADITNIALGSAIPLPTGGGAVAAPLEKGAQHAAVAATKATGKQMEKLNRYNPELGKFLLDEGLVKAGQNVEDLRGTVSEARKLADARLNETYKNIDEATKGKTVDVKDVIGHIEDAKNALSRAHTNDAAREALDKEIKTLLERYPDGFISAREAQEIKTAYGKPGYGKDVIPGSAAAEINRKISRIYKDSLNFSVKKVDPELAAALEAENRKASNLIAAEKILSGKRVPDVSMAESAIGVAGAFAHPAAAAIPMLSKQVRSRGASTVAALERAGSKAVGGMGEVLSRMAASPELKPAVDAAVRAVGVDMVNNIVDQYGEDDPRTRALLVRLASQGDKQ